MLLHKRKQLIIKDLSSFIKAPMYLHIRGQELACVTLLKIEGSCRIDLKQQQQQDSTES